MVNHFLIVCMSISGQKSYTKRVKNTMKNGDCQAIIENTKLKSVNKSEGMIEILMWCSVIVYPS